MSDNKHPHKIRREIERVFLCNEIWFDCLPFLSRAKVGFEFALVSDRFDGLADAHLNSKKIPWTLGRLSIEQRADQKEAIIYNWDTEKYFQFPDESLPENVIGFKRIDILYIDQNVIDFLHRIRRLFQPKNNGNDGILLGLYIHSSQVRSWDIFCDLIWPLVNPFAIIKLCFVREDTFDELCRRISPTFLLDWTNVHMLVAQFDVSFGNGEIGKLLRQWLYTPRKDGNPKLLDSYMESDAVEHLKTEFLSAQNAANFIITFSLDPDLFVPFELKNWCTGKRLKFQNVDKFNWLLERGPIGGRDAEKWVKSEREAMVMEKNYNVLGIQLCDNNIGSLDEVAGPSGQKLRK